MLYPFCPSLSLSDLHPLTCEMLLKVQVFCHLALLFLYAVCPLVTHNCSIFMRDVFLVHHFDSFLISLPVNIFSSFLYGYYGNCSKIQNYTNLV